MRRFLVGVTVAACAAAAMQIQVDAQQGGGRGVAAVTSTQDCDFHERAPQLLGK